MARNFCSIQAWQRVQLLRARLATRALFWSMLVLLSEPQRITCKIMVARVMLSCYEDSFLRQPWQSELLTTIDIINFVLE